MTIDNVVVIEKAIDLLRHVSDDYEIDLDTAACLLDLSKTDTEVIAEVLSSKGVLTWDMQRQMIRCRISLPLVFCKEIKARENDLPKGINAITLRTIVDKLKNFPPQWVGTSEEIGWITGFSKSTVRRYLEYLVLEKVIYIGTCYQRIGRPTVVYGIDLHRRRHDKMR